ncbi:MAG: hypothetical protein AMXMBFR78_12750 [Rubrivivax sp.]
MAIAPCRRLADGQLALQQRRVDGLAHAQRPGVAQQRQQQPTALGLGQRGVVGLQARHAQQLGDHRLVLVRALPQVDRGKVKAEDLHRALQRRQPHLDEAFAMALAQRLRHHRQIGSEGLGVGVGLLRRQRLRQRAGQRLLPGERLQRGRQPRVDADQRAPVGLVQAVLAAVR